MCWCTAIKSFYLKQIRNNRKRNDKQTTSLFWMMAWLLCLCILRLINSPAKWYIFKNSFLYEIHTTNRTCFVDYIKAIAEISTKIGIVQALTCCLTETTKHMFARNDGIKRNDEIIASKRARAIHIQRHTKKKMRIEWKRQQKGINNKSHVFDYCNRVFNMKSSNNVWFLLSQSTWTELAYIFENWRSTKFPCNFTMWCKVCVCVYAWNWQLQTNVPQNWCEPNSWNCK